MHGLDGVSLKCEHNTPHYFVQGDPHKAWSAAIAEFDGDAESAGSAVGLTIPVELPAASPSAGTAAPSSSAVGGASSSTGASSSSAQPVHHAPSSGQNKNVNFYAELYARKRNTNSVQSSSSNTGSTLIGMRGKQNVSEQQRKAQAEAQRL